MSNKPGRDSPTCYIIAFCSIVMFFVACIVMCLVIFENYRLVLQLAETKAGMTELSKFEYDFLAEQHISHDVYLKALDAFKLSHDDYEVIDEFENKVLERTNEKDVKRK